MICLKRQTQIGPTVAGIFDVGTFLDKMWPLGQVLAYMLIPFLPDGHRCVLSLLWFW